ncbi:hypothetical protein P3X46_018581 [Hevea brasiliensis]|uniref:Myb-like domain-containing protein n=2 Tax=Hevea brasiliensis TaxID=3981 RepID=A0ABQ9LSH1_HEVBR|nr:hypothetical protein P3X46_018581 [Hevea brasiliensis]
MPKRRTSRKPTTSTTTQAEHEVIIPLRRSNRFLHQKSHSKSDKLKRSNFHRDNRQKASKELRNFDGKSSICPTPVFGLRRSPRFSKRVECVSNIRRSLRLSLLGNTNAFKEKSDQDETKKSSGKSEKLRHSASDKSTNNNSSKKPSNRVLDESTDYKAVLLNKEKGKVGVDSCDEIVQRSEIRTQDCLDVELVIGLEASKGKFVFGRSQEAGVIRKRKRGAEGRYGSVKVWTRKQELALEKAYFAAKPTPHFWKKVSKLVPGKTAQDCFEKIHSEHITPPQPLPRSRAKRMNSSPLGCFSLSAGKLFSSPDLMVKRLSCYKRKSRITQKTVRQLLQKHNCRDQSNEADLFSILEPNVSPSKQDSQLNDVSTPQHLQEKLGFLQKSLGRSSSGQKKPLSRFRSSCGLDLVSPPVLKQVKNRALHEKYIDQLHCREAKRRAACARAGKENCGQANIQKIDVVRAAKNALVSDARDAINKLQDLQTDAKGDSSDLDDEINSDEEVDGF